MCGLPTQLPRRFIDRRACASGIASAWNVARLERVAECMFSQQHRTLDSGDARQPGRDALPPHSRARRREGDSGGIGMEECWRQDLLAAGAECELLRLVS